MSNLSRRLLLQAMPFIGASAAVPALAMPAPLTVQERFDHHLAELLVVMAETAGPCDGFLLTAGISPTTGKQWHRSRRSWILHENIRGDFYMNVERGGDFDPYTGHAIYDPLPDLSTWVPRRGGGNV